VSVADIDQLANYVTKARILSEFAFDQHGAHQSYLLVLEGGVGVLAKPEDEINLGDVLVRREVSAWIVARLLGWPDLVAVTVLRRIRSFKTGLEVAASVQVLWPFPERIPVVATFSDDEVWQAATFDSVVRHGDRRNNNWLAVPRPGTGVPVHLRLVDHGYAFDPGLAQPNSDFYLAKQGQALPEAVARGLESLQTSLPGGLQGLLPDPELAGVRERTEHLLRKKSLGFP
jgi:hypothetical protein